MQVMNDVSKTCSCGDTFTPQQSSGDTCFRCKVSNVYFGFRGVTGYGRKKFHDDTIRSVNEESDRRITAAGGDVKKDFEPAGVRWV